MGSRLGHYIALMHRLWIGLLLCSLAADVSLPRCAFASGGVLLERPTDAVRVPQWLLRAISAGDLGREWEVLQPRLLPRISGQFAREYQLPENSAIAQIALRHEENLGFFEVALWRPNEQSRFTFYVTQTYLRYPGSPSPDRIPARIKFGEIEYSISHAATLAGLEAFGHPTAIRARPDFAILRDLEGTRSSHLFEEVILHRLQNEATLTAMEALWRSSLRRRWILFGRKVPPRRFNPDQLALAGPSGPWGAGLLQSTGAKGPFRVSLSGGVAADIEAGAYMSRDLPRDNPFDMHIQEVRAAKP